MGVQNIGPFNGEWCDVDWSPADGAFVFAVLEQPGRIQLVWPTREGVIEPGRSFDLGRWGLYLRAAADGQGNVCCVLQDGRDRNPATGQYYPAVVVLFPKDGSPREIACPAGPAFGQSAVEVVRDDDEPDGWAVYVATSPSSFWTGWLSPRGEWRDFTSGLWRDTSQGFADGFERVDDVRLSVPGMVCPSTVDSLSIGQAGEPDRIRGLHQGVYFTVLPGAGFEPHLASDGQGRWMAAARTPQGAALVALTAPFEPEQAPPEPPPVLPDTPFVVDPTGVVEDVAKWIFSPDQGPDVHLSPDGRIRFFCKSDELSGDGRDPQIGEHWDLDADYIGHLEDASMGRRIYQGKPVSAETIVRLFPTDHARVWASLPLYRNWWRDGARVWLPRRCVSGYRLRYATDFLFNTGEVHPHVLIEIRVDVGHGVIHGKPVRVRGAYVSSPDNGRTWNVECNYYNEPNGSNAWKAGPFATFESEWMR
jgi:hypothetical protein